MPGSNGKSNRPIADLPPEDMRGTPGVWLASVIRECGAPGKGYEIVQRRVKQIAEAYISLRETFDEAPVLVRLMLFEPSPEAAYIRLTGIKIAFDDPEVFASAARDATNVDICLHTDSTVDIDFTFYGMLQTADGGECHG